MPKPVYIICAESGAEDRNTSIVSHFNVIEKFQVRPPNSLPYSPARMTAVWMQDPDESPGTLFEFEIRVCLPPRETWVSATSGTFSFSKPLHRFGVTLFLPPFQGKGTMWVECRVRRAGVEEWVSQCYPILVEDITPTASLADNGNSTRVLREP